MLGFSGNSPKADPAVSYKICILFYWNMSPKRTFQKVLRPVISSVTKALDELFSKKGKKNKRHFVQKGGTKGIGYAHCSY